MLRLRLELALGFDDVDAAGAGAKDHGGSAAVHGTVQTVVFGLSADGDRQITAHASSGRFGVQIEGGVKGNTDGDTAAGGGEVDRAWEWRQKSGGDRATRGFAID